MKLRDDQHELMTRARDALREHRRILLVASTGVGKTVLALEMIRGAISRGRRVLFLCHRRELVRQSSRAFWQSGVPHGMVMAGRNMTDTPANVGVINTVANRIGRMRPPDLIIVDEAHRSVSPMYQQVFAAWPDAHVVGLTATPERTDGRGLGEIYSRIVEARGMRWYIDNGILSDYEIIAPAQSLSLAGVSVRAGDYAQEELAAAVDKPTITGDAVNAYRQFAAGKRCMVFCVTIEHSKHVCAQYTAAGIPAEHVDGAHTDAERDEILGRFRRGETLVVTSVQLAIEGLDVPAIEAVQFLRPTKSLIVYLQAIGRGLRREVGKSRLIILDQVSNWLHHGLPDDARDWSLDGRKTRAKRGEAEPPVNVRQCKQCYAVFRATHDACPRCGSVVPSAGRAAPQTVDGELQKIDADAVRRNARREQGSARTLADLVALGQRRNISRPAEWAANVYAARQGRKPTTADYAQARAALA
jgi:DNA repair protein RadD